MRPLPVGRSPETEPLVSCHAEGLPEDATVPLPIRIGWFPGRSTISAAVLLVLSLGGAAQPGLAQESDQALKEWFLREAPERWQEYIHLSGKSQGILSVTSLGTLNDYQQTARGEYKINSRCKLLRYGFQYVSRGQVEKDQEEVFAVNPRYAFSLLRKSPESAWVLTVLVDLKQGVVPERFQRRFQDYVYGVAKPAMLGVESLADAVRSPGFRVDHCRYIQRDEQRVVEVAFTYTKALGQGTWTQTGTMVLDPNCYWCVRSADIQAAGDVAKGTSRIIHLQRDRETTGQLLPLTRVGEEDNDFVFQQGKRNIQRIRREATLSRPDRLPPDEAFTLSAFGLPEPAGAPVPAQAPWYLWTGAAGILCLCAGAWFRLLYRRRQAAGPD
jgi:hypothetical protein